MVNLTCFNTSHVTLYHELYSNSGIYRLGFNTSHVTLYPSFAKGINATTLSFNTSHVTLYPQCRYFDALHRLVSIHLMLLFI